MNYWSQLHELLTCYETHRSGVIFALWPIKSGVTALSCERATEATLKALSCKHRIGMSRMAKPAESSNTPLKAGPWQYCLWNYYRRSLIYRTECSFNIQCSWQTCLNITSRSQTAETSFLGVFVFVFYSMNSYECVCVWPFLHEYSHSVACLYSIIIIIV